MRRKARFWSDLGGGGECPSARVCRGGVARRATVAYKGKGAAFVLLGGLDGLETGRALEAVLREDRRQVVGLQGVDEVVDAVRAGRIRRGLRREIVTTTLPSKGSWPSARLGSATRTISSTRSGRPCRRRRTSSAHAAPRPSKSGVPFIDSVNARRLFSSIPPRALHSLTSSLRIIYPHTGDSLD